MGEASVQLNRLHGQSRDDYIGSLTASTPEHAKLLDVFLRNYCTPCFGGLAKREVDLLVFRLLIQAKQIDLESSQQSISRFLRIPISKVKSLIYETQLRDDRCDENWFRNEVLKVLQTARLSVSKTGAYIKLEIDNPMLRKELESKVKQLNGFADYSFNSDILKIDFEIYGFLIKKIVTDPSEQLKLEKALRTAINAKGTELLNWKDLVNEFLKTAAKETGEQVIDLTFGYLSGGASMFINSAKKLITRIT